jgi:hypothetical protein
MAVRYGRGVKIGDDQLLLLGCRLLVLPVKEGINVMLSSVITIDYGVKSTLVGQHEPNSRR